MLAGVFSCAVISLEGVVVKVEVDSSDRLHAVLHHLGDTVIPT
jgi:hypothetical protein